MGDETNDKPTISTGIYHELGKISSATESMAREIMAVRLDIRERTQEIVKKFDEHVKEDEARFGPLERLHANVYAVLATVSVFWIIATTLVVLWLKQ